MNTISILHKVIYTNHFQDLGPGSRVTFAIGNTRNTVLSTPRKNGAESERWLQAIVEKCSSVCKPVEHDRKQKGLVQGKASLHITFVANRSWQSSVMPST